VGKKRMTGGKETNDAVGKKVIWLPLLIVIKMRSINIKSHPKLKYFNYKLI